MTAVNAQLGLAANGFSPTQSESFVCDGSLANGANSGVENFSDSVLSLMDRLVERGLSPAECVPILRDHYKYEMEKIKHVSLSQSSIIDDKASSVVSLQSTLSRSSRRSIRRTAYLTRCEDIVNEAGYCYLLMVRTPSRLSVSKRCGKNPNLEKLLMITMEEFDLVRMRDLEFVQINYVDYHVQSKIDGNMIDLLRRTLPKVPDWGDGLRMAIGEDLTDGECLSFLSHVGSYADDLVVESPFASVAQELEDDDDRGEFEMIMTRVLSRDSVLAYYLVGMDDSLESIEHEENQDEMLYEHDDEYVVCSETASVEGVLAFSFPGVDSELGLLVMPVGWYASYGGTYVGSDEYPTYLVLPRRKRVCLLTQSSLSGYAAERTFRFISLDKRRRRDRWKGAGLPLFSMNAIQLLRSASFYIHSTPQVSRMDYDLSGVIRRDLTVEAGIQTYDSVVRYTSYAQRGADKAPFFDIESVKDPSLVFVRDLHMRGSYVGMQLSGVVNMSGGDACVVFNSEIALVVLCDLVELRDSEIHSCAFNMAVLSRQKLRDFSGRVF